MGMFFLYMIILYVVVPAPEEVSIVSIAMESSSLTWRFPFILMTKFEVRVLIINYFRLQ